MSEDFINNGKKTMVTYGNFLSDNKKNIMIVVGIILAIVVICYFSKKYFWEEKPKCINYDVQKRIADEIDAKLKELDTCDCNLDASQKIYNNQEKSKIEDFGNTNFY